MDWLSSFWGGLFSINVAGLNDDGKINALAAISEALAAFLSLGALILSLWVFSRQQRLDRWQLRLHREDHIIAWSRACLTLLAEVEEVLKSLEGAGAVALPNDRYISLRSQLSALIDEGRLYFPNIEDAVHGATKDIAYRGHRQPILDPLVAAYDGMKDVQTHTEKLDAGARLAEFNKYRRSFVSCCQAAIDPRMFNQIRA